MIKIPSRVLFKMFSWLVFCSSYASENEVHVKYKVTSKKLLHCTTTVLIESMLTPLYMRSKFFFGQCISIGVPKFAHLHNNENICPFWGVNLLSVSTVLHYTDWEIGGRLPLVGSIFERIWYLCVETDYTAHSMLLLRCSYFWVFFYLKKAHLLFIQIYFCGVFYSLMREHF